MSIAAYQGVCPTCRHDHSAPVTALASGSGDYAPAAWRVSLLDGGWVVCGFEQVAIDLAAARKGAVVQALYGPELIFEVAALRGGIQSLEIRRDFYKHNMQRAELRATEAERTLSEHRITADLLVSTLKADKEEAERKLAEAHSIVRAAVTLPPAPGAEDE